MIKFLFAMGLIAFGFFMAVFADPIWGIYLFMALSHIRLSQLGENIALPLNIPIIIASLSLLLYLISSKYEKKFSRWPQESFLLGIVVAGMAISSYNTYYNSHLSWGYTLIYLKYWVFFILLIQMFDSFRKIEMFHRVMVLSSVWLVYRCWDLRGTTGARFENFGGDIVSDANHFAAALVFLFPFVFQKVFSRKRYIAVSAVILCFGICMSIIITVSRGGFLGLIALVILLLINYKENRKKLAVIVIVLGLTMIPFVSEYQRDRLSFLQNSMGEENLDTSSQSRIEYWKLSLQLFKENKLSGIGIGNFPYYSGYLLEGKKEGVPGHVAHSIWFEVLTEGGLIVTVPFLLVIVYFYRRTGRTLRTIRQEGVATEQEIHIKTIRIALTAFLVSATFLNRLIYEPLYWCIALGVAHASLIKKKDPVSS